MKCSIKLIKPTFICLWIFLMCVNRLALAAKSLPHCSHGWLPSVIWHRSICLSRFFTTLPQILKTKQSLSLSLEKSWNKSCAFMPSCLRMDVEYTWIFWQEKIVVNLDTNFLSWSGRFFLLQIMHYLQKTNPYIAIQYYYVIKRRKLLT